MLMVVVFYGCTQIVDGFCVLMCWDVLVESKGFIVLFL